MGVKTHPILCRGCECAQIHLHSPIRLQGAVLS